MSIRRKRFNEFPEGSGSLTADDVFLFMDDPSGAAVTKKISLNQLSEVLGTGTSFEDVPLSDNIIYGRRNQQWVDLTTPANLQIRRGTQSEINQIIPLSGEPVWTTDTKNLRIGDGSAYGGSSIGLQDTDRYVFCRTGDSLLDKYNQAKLLTPGGNIKSNSNRVTLFILPGNYNVPSSTITFDTEFVDIIGLGSIKKHRGCECAVFISDVIQVNANDIRVCGLSTGRFSVAAAKPLQIIENCKATNSESFGGSQDIAGTFINCECSSESGGFGGTLYATLSGKFINCKARDDSFGADLASLTGYFNNCEAGENSFGFQTSTTTGKFENCIAGNNSFGGFGSTSSGIFINCVAGSGSFGGGGGVAAGKYMYCILTSGNFTPPTNGGKHIYCIDGNYNTYSNTDPIVVGG